ncbi:MAG: hypothetical protein ACOC93_01300 [Planctomycetota bacterium]
MIKECPTCRRRFFIGGRQRHGKKYCCEACAAVAKRVMAGPGKYVLGAGLGLAIIGVIVGLLIGRRDD